MTTGTSAAWDGLAGTAGGPSFGAGLGALVDGRGGAEAFGAAHGFEPGRVAALVAGEARASVTELARLAQALKLRAIEFMQRTNLLSLELYASGLDPLFFVPPGGTRHDARIYMREINPRHAVPERDMLVRNPVLKALLADDVLDPLGKLEVELAYLLRAAVQSTGGSL